MYKIAIIHILLKAQRIYGLDGYTYRNDSLRSIHMCLIDALVVSCKHKKGHSADHNSLYI
jgi:hypothetical protein